MVEMSSTEVGKWYDGDKAVSSVYGKIDRILFVFWQYLFPNRKPEDNDDQYTKAVMKAALKFYDPIICPLLEKPNSGVAATKLNVLLLIEFDVELKLPFSYRPKKRPTRYDSNLKSDSWIHEFSESMMADFIVCDEKLTLNPSTGTKTMQDENGIRTRAVRASSDRLDVDFIFMNLDFDLLAEESLSALDFKSALFSAKGTRDMNHSVQDPFIAVKRGRQVVLLDPYYSWPTHKGRRGPHTFKQVPEVLSSQTDILVRGFPFFIQGGNILIGDDYAVVGGDIIRLNVDSYKGKEKESRLERQRQQDGSILDKLRKSIQEKFRDGLIDKREKKILETELLEVASELLKNQRAANQSQPPFNDKKFLKLLGNYLGVDHVTSPLCPRHDSEENLRNLPEFFHLDTYMTLAGRDKDGREIILIGKLYEWRKSKQEVWGWRRISKKSDAKLRGMKAYLKDVKTYFSSKNPIGKKTKVIRLPLLYHNGTLFSYNNCLVEHLRKKPNEATPFESTLGPKTRIFIPQFRSKAIDDLLGYDQQCMFELADLKVKQLLCDHGFDVRPVCGMNLRAMAYSQVGLHCLSSVLSRVDVNPNSECDEA